jgi:hypothetical protein
MISAGPFALRGQLCGVLELEYQHRLDSPSLGVDGYPISVPCIKSNTALNIIGSYTLLTLCRNRAPTIELSRARVILCRCLFS